MTIQTRGHQGELKQRLLKAGEEVFARAGYHHATIREICRNANVNIAMINYHFGGKASLYKAVLEHSVSQSMRTFVPLSEPGKTACPEKQLHEFVLSVLSRALDARAASPTEQMIEWELTYPTFALSTVVDNVLRPRADQGNALIRQLMGNQATEDEVHWIRQSVVAQCLHYRYNRHLLHRLYPGHTFGPEEIPVLARHITRFSLAGILAYRSPGHRSDLRLGEQEESLPASHAGSLTDTRDSACAGEAKLRVLEAALELFAEVGYEHVTVREICQHASVNIAMVSYYFGGKEKLYRAVVDHACALASSQLRPRQSLDRNDLERRLEAFVFSLVSHLLNEECSPWCKRLIAREVAEPTFALEILVNRVVRPGADQLHAIVRAFLGSRATDADVQLYAESIAAQCLYYQFAKPVLRLLFPAQQYGPKHSGQLTEHITRFSLAALQALNQSSVN